jgi:hypothetical protein
VNREAERQSMVRYTIMPDYGGAYGWINREGTDTLGPNHADTTGWGGDHPISEELQEAFAAWQTEFERATNEWEAGIALLDWPRFHERGMALARRLKAELGDAARIYYEKPCEDPNQRVAERVEILADGTVVETVFPRRLQTSLPDWLPNTVVSGGQTGVDRAALDWACNHRIPHGGWCPQGRRASDGPLSLKYQLRETESAGYRQRTKLNAQDSDATLILNAGELDGGTLQTLQFAERMGKPHLVVQLDQGIPDELAGRITEWLVAGKFNTLNVAGPREEKRPGIYALTLSVLDRCAASPEEKA